MSTSAHTGYRSRSILDKTWVLLLSILLITPLAILQGATPVMADVVTPAVAAKIDFAPAATAAASGYVKDTGTEYTDASGMGWIRQDSLAGTHVPYNGLTINTRNRAACTALPVQQRSFIHMQAPSTSTTNDLTPGAWEYAVPNGEYQVTVGVGDPDKGQDAESHVINVEGVRAIDGYPSSSAASCTTGATNRAKISTAWATVADGKLTIDAVGGINTKLSYVTIDSASVSDLTATPSATDISLNWTGTSSAFRVWRSTNLPVPTSGAPFATTTFPTYSDTTAVPGTLYYYAVANATNPGTDLVGAIIDNATPTQPTLPAKFDFAETPGVTPASVTPAGFTRDYGQNYANLRGYGWLAAGTSTPLSLIGNGRSRVAGSNDPLNSPIHMQGNTVAGFANIADAGTWQLAVPNGSYDVELAVGDATPGSDPTTHRINVEGQNAINNFTIVGTPTGAARFQVVTKTVAVSDGFLTVDAIGGINTKIDYITVTPTPSDQPPAKPAGLTAVAGDASVTLDWADNTDSDIKGYNVYRGAADPVAITGTPLNGATVLTSSAFVDTTAVNESTYRYVVVAVDNADQKSVASDSAAATPDAANPTLATLPIKINFMDATTPLDAGFTRDFGQAWNNTRGRGWVVPGTHTPVDLSANSRFRVARAGVDVRQRGLMHMQAQDVAGSFTGTKAPGSYELAVPNGSYKVTVSSGDQMGATSYDSVHTVNVEGTAAISAFQGTAAAEFKTGTVTVPVTDGKLTIDANGGTNTKINYLDVESVDVTAPGAPSGVGAAAGDAKNTITWTASTDADLAGYNVYGAAGNTVAVGAATKLTATAQTGISFEHTGLTNATQYSYVVTAVDNSGNESVASSVSSATPADGTAPAAPGNLLAAAGDEAVSLSWTAPADTDIAGYRIYRSETTPVDITGTPTASTLPDTLTFSDTGLTNDTEYFYAVTAVDTVGNQSAASAEKSATPTLAPDVTAPVAPAGLIAAAGDSRITLTWTANAEGDIAGYQVYRSAAAGSVGGTLL
ncbi:MAG: fibronectin type III domain-containing protein, partial [Nakamurella sp.]